MTKASVGNETVTKAVNGAGIRDPIIGRVGFRQIRQDYLGAAGTESSGRVSICVGFRPGHRITVYIK